MQLNGNGRGQVRGLMSVRARFSMTLLALGTLLSPVAKAQISVSSGGSPSYGVSIGVPPGIAGMTPNLGLAFTGGGVNGPAGYGWTLTGVSLISRCQGNVATDGKPLAVKYTPADRLCLDGQRLIETSTAGVPVASTPAANGALLDANGRPEDGTYTEYRTDKDIYSRIRAYGMANGATTNGPRYFKVWTKAGQIYEYGAGPSSDPATTNALIVPSTGSVVAAWAVARISDTVGNFIDFKYSYQNVAWGSGAVVGTATSGHEWNISEIQYTGTASQPANNKVVFEYESRPDTPGASQDRSEAYHGGSKNVSTQRLKAVRTYVNWAASSPGASSPSGALVTPPASAVKVKAIKLSYETGNTGRSRLIATKECVGAAETTCLPGAVFHYATASTNEQYTPSANFSASSLATLQLEKADGTMGVLLGDFNGDGRTDIIRWSDTPSLNVLYTSNGDGSFTQNTNFALTTANLFKSDGCFASMAMDFNADGRTDILRVMQPTSSGGASCGTPANYLYLSNGDGTFTTVTLPAGVDFTQKLAVPTQTMNCGPNTNVVRLSKGAVIQTTPCQNPTYTYTRTAGANYHIVDVNGDGIPDIITTVEPFYFNQSVIPSADSLCASITCTHLYLGSPTGVFSELLTTNLIHHSVYGPPRPTGAGSWSPTRFRPYLVDYNADGLLDLLVDTGLFFSTGDGNFTEIGTSASSTCTYPLDFNGDGTADCLNVNAPTSPNTLVAGIGLSGYAAVAGFNVLGTGKELNGTGVGFVLADLDADGRTDIIRWKDDPTQNVVYLSNGDGTFRTSTAFNLNTAAYALKKSDGSVDFVTADFTGNGNTEILRTVSSIAAGSAATTNQLFVKSTNVPPDQLTSMTSATGLSSVLTYIALPNSISGSLGARYLPGPSYAAAAVYPKVDLTIPMWVVATQETATGVGATTVKDEYLYGGLRASFGGYGLLGFATVKEQHAAADGSPLTTVTSYLQDGAYIGVAGVTQTLDGALNQPAAAVISRTTNSYCDTTSTAVPSVISTGGVSPAPCPTTSLVQRPYLYQTFEEGWDIDLNRTALPTVATTNTFNGSGDATNIVVTTLGTSVGVQQTVTKTTSNAFYPDATSGDNWILGRLSTSTQTNSVPNILGSIATSAGTGKYATATSGVTLSATLDAPSVAGTTVGQSSTATATLTNTSGGTLGVTVPTASSVAGTDFAFVATTCTASLAQGTACTVTIRFSPTAALTRAGTLSIQTEAGLKSVAYSGQGLTPSALTLSGCASISPTVAPTGASMTCTVGNSGQSAASGIVYASSLGGSILSAGPTTCAANTGNCGSVTLTTPVGAGAYGGNLTATSSAGAGASAAFSLTVNSAAALTLTSCVPSTGVTAPSPASTTCTVGNTGQTAAAGIAYSSTLSGMSLSAGPTTCAASTSNCGAVTLTTPGTAGNYVGNLVATPSTGGGASSAFNLTVNTPGALSLTGCSANSGVTSPAQASQTCTVGNTGQTTASGIAYSASLGGVTLSGGPTTCAATTANCGTVVLTTPGTAGTYAGTMSGTPSAGSAGSAGFNLVVNTPAALSLSGCTSTTGVVAPSTASQTCTVGNSGQTSASGIAYASTLSGMTVSGGPATCAAGTTNCGSVTVTTPPTAGSYSGSLTATPGSGSAASVAFALVVSAPPAQPFHIATPTISTSGNILTATWVTTNPGASAATVTAISLTVTNSMNAVRTGTCAVGASIPASGSCTIVAQATKTCLGSYKVTPSISNSGGTTTASLGMTVPGSTPSCAIVGQPGL